MFLYMTMDIYSIYMRNDDPWKSFIYAKVTILEKFYISSQEGKKKKKKDRKEENKKRKERRRGEEEEEK